MDRRFLFFKENRFYFGMVVCCALIHELNLGFSDYGLFCVFVKAKLHNLGYLLIDATVVQNAVAAASAASSTVPVVNVAFHQILGVIESVATYMKSNGLYIAFR